MNIKEAKKALRQQYKTFRFDMDPQDKAEKDSKIFQRIQGLWSFKEADTIFTYVSTKIEIDTQALIQYALDEGKKVAVPYCIEHTNEMDFYYINDPRKDLECRTFGVMEPKPGLCKKVTDFTQGLCIVPGLLYDTKGYRLGYGKGYYDRFLSRFSGVTMGLIYSDCVIATIPHGRFDQRVDILISEKFVKPTIRL